MGYKFVRVREIRIRPLNPDEIRVDLQPRRLVILGVGHLATDISQGALPALLLFSSRVPPHYSAAAGIVFAANIFSLLIRPCRTCGSSFQNVALTGRHAGCRRWDPRSSALPRLLVHFPWSH